MAKLCPQCGGELDRVTQGDHAMLNSEQFNAIKAGDYVCDTCPDNNRGKSGKAYFWEREVVDTLSRGLTDAECLREVALIVGKSCDEDVIAAVQRVLMDVDRALDALASATDRYERADAKNILLSDALEAAQSTIEHAVAFLIRQPVTEERDTLINTLRRATR